MAAEEMKRMARRAGRPRHLKEMNVASRHVVAIDAVGHENNPAAGFGLGVQATMKTAALASRCRVGEFNCVGR
jgi:hypothetical protein